MRKLFGCVATILMAALVLSGCPTESNDEGPEILPIAGPSGALLTGTGSGREWGFHGWVDVELTLADGIVTVATVTGPDETPGVGAVVVARAGEAIKKINSVEIPVIVSGASITTNAVRKAGRLAIEAISAAFE
jgi:hypothetical protein